MLCSNVLSLKLSLLLNSRLGKSHKVPIVLKKLKQVLWITLTFLSYFFILSREISFRGKVTILFESSTSMFLQYQDFIWNRKSSWYYQANRRIFLIESEKLRKWKQRVSYQYKWPLDCSYYLYLLIFLKGLKAPYVIFAIHHILPQSP